MRLHLLEEVRDRTPCRLLILGSREQRAKVVEDGRLGRALGLRRRLEGADRLQRAQLLLGVG